MNRFRYKITEIGEIPEDWGVLSFEEAFNKEESIQSKIPTSKFKNKGKFPIIDQGRDLISGYTDNEELLYKGKLPLIIFGDHTLCVKYVDFRFAVGADGTKLLIPNNQRFTPKFLYYALLGKNLKSEGYKRHFSKLRRQSFQCPEIKEQQKIAEILSTADETIQKVNEEITLTGNLKKGLMQTLLTKGIGHTKFKMTSIGDIPEEWGVSKLNNIFKIFTGTTPSTKMGKYWYNGSVEWLTPKDLSQMADTIVLPPSERKITREALEQSGLNFIPEESILISTRAPVGYVGINKIKITFNQGCKALVPIEHANNDSSFYAYYLKYRRNYLDSVSSGSTFKELSKETMASLDIPMPPLPEQQEIAEILSTVDNKLRLLNDKKGYLEKLKRGLMYDLLTGKIRVKINTSKGEN